MKLSSKHTIIICLLSVLGISVNAAFGQKVKIKSHGLEVPFFADATFLIVNPDARYTLMYDTAYRQASWVAYLLTRAEARKGAAQRKNKFIPDPHVKKLGWPTAVTTHYTNTGYDRGHLLPSADRNGTQKENDATFHLSNVSPQRPALNRRVWKNLEDQVRRLANRYDSLYVVTGGVLECNLDRINGGVGVPRYFYKTLMVKNNGSFRAIAYLMPNEENIKGAFTEYAITLDSLERVTGFNFYHQLPDSTKQRISFECDRQFWGK